MAQFIAAEVIDTQISFKESEHRDTDEVLPHGTIRIKYTQTNIRKVITNYAIPLDPYITDIPIVGEYVMLIQLIDKDAGPFIRRKKYYYFKSINIFDRLDENILKGIQSIATPNAIGMKNTNDPNVINDEESIQKLQPYQGDRIFHSRYGSSIRFSSNNTVPDEDLEYETKNELWSGTVKTNPITLITNGYKKTNNRFYLENPKDDKSIIYLTSDQRVKITSSQKNIGTNAIPIKNYNKSQVIISADRLLFNAKDDRIILSGKKSVNIATPNWQIDMNKFFNLFDNFLDEIIKTAAGTSNYLTGVGPTFGNPTLLAAANAIKAQLTSMRQK